MARQIELKIVPFMKSNEAGNLGPSGSFDYRRTMVQIVELPSNMDNGVSLDDIRLAVPLLDKLAKAKSGTTVVLENKEWEVLTEKMKHFRWGVISETILRFVEDIESAPKADLSNVLATPPAAPRTRSRGGNVT